MQIRDLDDEDFPTTYSSAGNDAPKRTNDLQIEKTGTQLLVLCQQFQLVADMEKRHRANSIANPAPAPADHSRALREICGLVGEQITQLDEQLRLRSKEIKNHETPVAPSREPETKQPRGSVRKSGQRKKRPGRTADLQIEKTGTHLLILCQHFHLVSGMEKRHRVNSVANPALVPEDHHRQLRNICALVDLQIALIDDLLHLRRQELENHKPPVKPSRGFKDQQPSGAARKPDRPKKRRGLSPGD